MNEIECISCRHMIILNRCHWCILTREKIHDPFEQHYCDYWRLDEGLRSWEEEDVLHDNNAMERHIEEDAADLHHEE